MTPPGPKSDWQEWLQFHQALVISLHTHPDLLIACECDPDIDLDPTCRSPWTNGACGLIALAVYEWADQPRRALWMMLARRIGMSRMQREWAGYDTSERVRYTYPHAIVRYKSDVLGFIYFDGVSITRDEKDMLSKFMADEVLPRTKDSHGWMAENFGIDPFDERRVELVKQVLVSTFGRWPK